MWTVSITQARRNLAHWVAQAGAGFVVLTSRGKPRAVLISMDAFEALLGMRTAAGRELVPLGELRQGVRAALTAAGYADREQIVALVQEVKRELAAERDGA